MESKVLGRRQNVSKDLRQARFPSSGRQYILVGLVVLRTISHCISIIQSRVTVVDPLQVSTYILLLRPIVTLRALGCIYASGSSPPTRPLISPIAIGNDQGCLGQFWSILVSKLYVPLVCQDFRTLLKREHHICSIVIS